MASNTFVFSRDEETRGMYGRRLCLIDHRGKLIEGVLYQAYLVLCRRFFVRFCKFECERSCDVFTFLILFNTLD